MKNNNLAEFFKKYAFYIGVGALTILLVIIFRQKKLNEFVREGKEGLASFYAQSLKPLIYTNEITNEDVFNFAMFNSLPVNKKENKLLFVSQDETGKNSIIIRNSQYKENTDNYRQFMNYLELNQESRNQFDSLLSYYKAKLYTAVLADGGSAIAVNQNIPVLRDLLYADILHFANTKNYAKAKQIYTEKPDMIGISEMKRLEDLYAGNDKKQDYLLMNNDSLYTVSFSTDMPDISFSKGKSETKWRDEFDNSKIWANEENVHNIEKTTDLFKRYSPSRYNRDVKVYVPESPAPKELANALEKLKNIPKLSKMITVETEKNAGKKGPISFKMNFNLSKIDSLVTNTLDAALQLVPQTERDKVRREIDSALKESAELRKNSDWKNQIKNSAKTKLKKN